MTLVATFAADGTPFLIGDSLITSSGQVTTTRTTPLLDRLPSKPSHINDVPVQELVQKILIISDSFCLGFSGFVYPAQDMIKGLRTEFRNNPPLRSTLSAYLRKHSYQPSKEYSLVGWLIEDSIPRTFHWDSASPSEIQFDNSDGYSIGSGSRYFYDKVSNARIIRQESSSTRVLTIISRLLGDEAIYGEPLADSFGGVYQIAYFDGSKFRYISSVTYIFLKLEETIQDKEIGMIGPINWLIARQYHDCMEVQSMLIDEQTLGHNKPPAVMPKSSMYYIPTILIEIGDQLTVHDNLPLRSDYYCISTDLKLVNPHLPIMQFNLVFPHKDSMQYLEINDRNGIESLGLRNPFFDSIFKAVKAIPRDVIS